MYTFEPIRSYSVPEAAKILGISRAAVTKRIKAGTLYAERIGRNYSIHGTHLSAALKTTSSSLVDSPNDSAYEIFRSLFPDVPPEQIEEAHERFSAYIRLIARIWDRLEKEGRTEEARALLKAQRKELH